ncbi:inorganic pyrophosphatase [Neorickettsia helminthoeca str. Oregon]|uniref:Inorganic pyrophosphatase n=1 Tax=Neorickettsia helminthoeca str. Oregon TaxID=1286528 RepID=X5H4K6_9RICK|nr:inorganic diphosphatase [Neorickettsia helminthoeca]AHX11628.1 inorganic pyrophosphatase [Neorickettsia helminthoeca str. Oregon]
MEHYTHIKQPQDFPREVNVIVEIPSGSSGVKYEIGRGGILHVDRFIPVSMYYPCNYAFIPNTLGGDGDPLDVLVVTRAPLMPGSLIQVRMVGAFVMRDEKGEDEKLLAVPASKVDPYYSNITAHTDFPEIFLKQIEHFFEHYKDLESGKFVEVVGWSGPDAAQKLVTDSVKSW